MAEIPRNKMLVISAITPDMLTGKNKIPANSKYDGSVSKEL